jgi:hypothetical protein
MTGTPKTKKQLNSNLRLICTKLNEYKINNWFIAYGTLLGIVRDGSCIDGDDDIDIVIDVTEISKVKECVKYMVDKESYQMTIDKKGKFMQISKEDCQLDFYFAENDGTNFFDLHEKVTWSECIDPETNKVPSIGWNGIKINVPHERILKLQRRYGPEWQKRIKKNEPGGEGYRTVLVL